MPKKSKNRENQIRIRSKFQSVSPISTAVAASNLGSIGIDPSSILANDINLSYLADMFRLFRINSVTFHFQPATSVGTANVAVPSGMVMALPFAQSANPTDIASGETPNISTPTIPWSCTTTTAAPLTRETGTSLSLRNSDLPVLQGPGNGWLATQADGTQTSYGTLWWLQAGLTAANTINYLLRTVFDVSLKDLLDPSLISALFARHPQGLPPHWQLNEGSILHSVNESARQGIKFSPTVDLGVFAARRLCPERFSEPTTTNDPSDTYSSSQDTTVNDADAQLAKLLEQARAINAASKNRRLLGAT